MSVQPILEVLKKHYALHESLLTLSKKKTEALKSDDIDTIQTLLVQERKHVQGINGMESKRAQLVGEWFRFHSPQTEEYTVSAMLRVLPEGEEKQALADLLESFVMVLAQLKEQEQLNTELTQQSLQFVDLTLNMIQPQTKNMNYGNPKGQQAKSESNRSMFDSKA
ncbi:MULTISPECIES: flagellar protein FlgN [Pontibacillus]|uniref:Flagellar protein FlgN n=1 Tax=Pontibacillus chungwhensis TaxID=265426 RepID=A0ABY8UW28_9BACI|nr:flagellar protein FlgN [Pontibacillus chungwhensis]MCD5325913.1 flagellar protein FlgN [Pontibacillus sp. HN14]WIF97623.1 flagellar protein FlgN [Pontibacillus chungwhensis]